MENPRLIIALIAVTDAQKINGMVIQCPRPDREYKKFKLQLRSVVAGQTILSKNGGEGEIRTHEPRKGPPVFKTGAFNRSATSPLNNSAHMAMCGRAIVHVS